MSTLREAIRLISAGRSVIPVGEDKRPISGLLPLGDDGKPTWAPFQAHIADEPTVRRWFANGAHIAIVAGRVSGFVLVIDFDEMRFYETWCERVGSLADGLVLVRTRRGVHVYLRCPEPGRNDKLAYVADDTEESGRRAAIETRGEGGYVRLWEVVRGDMTAIPMIPQAQADALLNAARQLDEAPYNRQQLAAMARREAGARGRPKAEDGASVIDAYNAAIPIETALSDRGYRVVGERAIRPGGQHCSVTIRDGRSFHHNSGDPLADGYWHAAFDVYCQLDHGGNVKGAVKAAAARLGMSYLPAPPNPPPEPEWPPYEDAPPDMPADEPQDDERKRTPTEDELRDRFIQAHPLIVYGVGEFRQYQDGVYPVLGSDVVRAGIMDVLEAAKSEKVRPSARLLASVLELVRIKVARPAERWDTDAELLPLRNGALHIPTRELRPHSPSNYFTSALPFDYDPDAYASTWDWFLSSTVPDAAGFLQEFSGCALTPDTKHELATWLFGPPGSGKSTFLLGLQTMLGSRAGLLSLANIQRSSFALANLPGKTLVVSTEQPADYIASTHILNALISGEPIEVDRKFRDAVIIIPRAKLGWAMNSLPRIGEAASGLFRRVKVVHFPPIPEAQRDPQVKERIAQEGAGILNWALAGLDRLTARGRFEIPACVRDATEQFRQTNDIPAQFVAECCLTGPQFKTKGGDLYRAYRQWALDTGHKPQSMTSIAADWDRLGFDKYEAAGYVYRRGLGLKESGL